MSASYCSASTGGFYPALDRPLYEAAGTFPDDAVLLSDDELKALREGVDAGKVIVSGDSGRPVLADPSPLSLEERKEVVRALRSAAYRAEADPLRLEADYDALLTDTAPNLDAWMAKVAEIKQRYPMPE